MTISNSEHTISDDHGNATSHRAIQAMSEHVISERQQSDLLSSHDYDDDCSR